jgi:lipoprotein-anchoring transpeptidase ErfK/SrfK
VGAKGTFAKLLEKRLDQLGYFLKGIDRSFDARTADALRAFNKVQGRPRLGDVDEATWRALASPRKPRPRFSKPRFHVEVDQTRQVMYFVKKKAVARVFHVSTGAGGATHDGSYQFFRQLAGTSGGGLYFPSYFDGLRAIHGWREVPTYAASHGCVRVPMWAAQWIQHHLDLGDRIYIYH